MSTVAVSPGSWSPSEDSAYEPLDPAGQRRAWITVAVLTAVLCLIFFDSLWRTGQMWLNPQYQFGMIIPVIAGFLLHRRREPFVQVPAWHQWIGVGLIAGGMFARVLASLMSIVYVDNVAFIPCLLGAFVLVGGLPVLRWAGPAILFLIFMYPFPRAFEERLMNPLQKVATRFSTAALVTLGVDAVRGVDPARGENLIYLPHRAEPMNVAEQCSGLRMSTILTGMAVAFALFATNRTWWERGIVILSAIPIAIIVNVARITLTGLAFTLSSKWNLNEGWIDTVSHDFAGLLMILMAFGLLLLEFQILKHLVVEVPEEVQPMMVPR